MSKRQYTIGAPRPLREEEKSLLIAMLAGAELSAASIEKCLVQNMNDGGMGSIRFVGAENRRFGSTPVEAHFHDEDGTPVIATVIVDQRGELYELDVWKVDFSQLKRIPPFEEITVNRLSTVRAPE